MSMSSWGMLRSIQNSERVNKHQLTRGTTRRILQFARPYRAHISVFLITVVLDAVIGVATPLLAGHVVNAITGGRSDAAAVIVRLALAIAGLAVIDAFLSLAQRWYSARIGEGIILDLRTKVYDHVQRMPLQFFTRTQTGALVSRLNNDVTGAQRAFTSTLSGVVSTRHPAGPDRRGDVQPVLADHPAVVAAAAAVHHPGPAGGQEARRDHPRVVQPRTPR